MGALLRTVIKMLVSYQKPTRAHTVIYIYIITVVIDLKKKKIFGLQ